MSSKPDLGKVYAWDRYFDRAGSKDEDAQSIQDIHSSAVSYLSRFSWCAAIREEYVGFIHPGIVAVFLFRFQPTRDDIDEWTWVVVGDLPPAYITCDDSPNPACALDAYIGAMEDWVRAAETGQPTDHLIPVNVDATPENAARLKSRLQFLDKEILSGYQKDLQA